MQAFRQSHHCAIRQAEFERRIAFVQFLHVLRVHAVELRIPANVTAHSG